MIKKIGFKKHSRIRGRQGIAMMGKTPCRAKRDRLLATDGLGQELVPNGKFDFNIDGFSARNAATIVHNETDGNKPGCLDCNISGVGGGFTTNLIATTIPGEVFRVSIDLKNISYVGALKIKVGAGEAVIAAALTNDWVTYTVDDTAISLTKLFELHRDGTIGAFLADNLSVRKIL